MQSFWIKGNHSYCGKLDVNLAIKFSIDIVSAIKWMKLCHAFV